MRHPALPETAGGYRVRNLFEPTPASRTGPGALFVGVALSVPFSCDVTKG